MLFEKLVEMLDPEPHSAALNMAIDEVLLARAGEPTLRIYRWERASVSFGYFGKLEHVESAWPRREMVRRWTGGGIVPHGEDVTYTLVVPRSCEFFRIGAAESYRAIHECIASLLNETGCDVRIAPRAASKISDACFENPARYDLLADGGKIAGAAQRRTRAGLLHQGSIQGVPMDGDFRAGLAGRFGRRIVQRVLDADAIAWAQALAAAKYATDAWLRKI
jgi:lipoate-protein ligase A